MIRFEGVSKTLGGHRVLDDICLELRASEIHFVIGKSGAGKSVLLRHVVGLLSPDEGRVFVEDLELSGLSSEQWDQVRKKCGMVFQFPALFDFLNVGDNVAFAFRDTPAGAKKKRVSELLEQAHLSSSLARGPVQELSFGEQKRVSIARALGADPKYLLFDEPTTGLDPIAARAIDRLILELRDKGGLGCLVVSHDIQAALHLADRISVLDEGRVIVHGSPSEIRKHSHPIVRSFVRAIEGTER